MRFYEFCGDDPNERKPKISLGHINRLKKVKQARRDEFAQRKILMGLMYADDDETLDAKARELDMRERELESRERILKGEIGLMISQAEVSQESREHIQKMADRFLSRK